MMHNPSTKAFALIMEYFRPLHKYNNIDNGNNTCGTGLNCRQYCVPGKPIVSKVTNESSPSPFCGRGTKEEALARTPSMKALYKLCHLRKIELLELDFAGTGGSSCFDTQLKKIKSSYIHRDSLPSSIHLALLTTEYSMSCGRGKDPEPQPVKVTSHVRAKDSNVNDFVERVSKVIEDKTGKKIEMPASTLSGYLASHPETPYVSLDPHGDVRRRIEEKAAQLAAEAEEKEARREEKQRKKDAKIAEDAAKEARRVDTEKRKTAKAAALEVKASRCAGFQKRKTEMPSLSYSDYLAEEKKKMAAMTADELRRENMKKKKEELLKVKKLKEARLAKKEKNSRT